MDKKDILAGLAIAGILTLSAATAYFRSRTFDANRSSYTQKESQVASEKTAALSKLFETEAFKNGTSYDQQRLISAVDRLYT